MHVCIRCDASQQIGSGHVMRCLALAESMRVIGAEVEFSCRQHAGNLIGYIRSRDFIVHELFGSFGNKFDCVKAPNLRHEYAEWLGVSQLEDANETIFALQGRRPQWLIVDHYGLDRTWEGALRPHVENIMAIDDLADRGHDCELILDQNFFIDGETRYDHLVSPSCIKLLGPSYALLRREFSEARKILAPKSQNVQRVLVFFGGVDQDNVTGSALEALSASEFYQLKVDVVLGEGNPHKALIEKQVLARAHTTLHVQINNIAELMAGCDLSLGAGGSTTWERLCLGLRSLVVTVAENQIHFIKDLSQAGFLTLLGSSKNVSVMDIRKALSRALKEQHQMYNQAQKGMILVLGHGAEIVANRLAGSKPKLSHRL